MIVDLTPMRSGFCNRLRQVTFCAAVARLRGDSNLVIRESPNDFCPYHFLDLCRIEGFDLAPWNEALGPGEIAFSSSDSPSLGSVRRRRPAGMPRSDEEILEAWLACYRLLRPGLGILEKIETAGAGPNHVGLHVRLTDKVKESPSPWEIHACDVPALEERTHRLLRRKLARSSSRSVFLACDDSAAKARWERRLRAEGLAVATHQAKFDPRSLRQTDGEDFAADLFGLARCASVVATTSSAVARSAAWIGGKSLLVAAETFPRARVRIAWENLKRSLAT